MTSRVQVIEIVGIAGVVAGVGSIYWPAGLIVGGALLLAAGIERGGR